jgi:signal transduction histidine kinase
MSEGASRTAEIIAGLRSFSRTDDQALTPIDLEQSLETTLVLLRNVTKDRIEVRKHYHFDLPHIMGYAGPLNQVFMNILHNATQAIEGQGTITLTTEADEDTVKVQIADSGCGMEEELKAQIFEAFFTTKDENQGTGLGLTISQQIVQEHRGRIELESEPGKGTTFTIWLPRNLEALLAAEALV